MLLQANVWTSVCLNCRKCYLDVCYALNSGHGFESCSSMIFSGFYFITAMINHVFSIAVQIYEFSYIHFSTFYGYVTNSQSGQLPIGLIAKLVERCTDRYRRGYGFESLSVLNFFQALISQVLKCYYWRTPRWPPRYHVLCCFELKMQYG